MTINKKILLFPLLGLLLTGIKLSTSKDHIKVDAATPMPTNINMTNSTDAEVSTYYAGVNGKSGDALLGFLYTKIKDHNEYDYENNTHRFIYKIIDRNWDLDAIDTESKANTTNFDYTNDNGFIHKLYADYNDDINTADRFKNVGATRVSFDKEHIWAQSLGNFGRTGGAGSDFHALWPSDVKGNQQGHSNYSFGIPQTGITSYNNDYGTYVGRNGYIAGSPNKVFEPLDQYKGDVARAMFYMPARYYQYVDTLHPKLELVNSSPDAHTASTSVTGKAGILDTLLAWHELDPVDDYEIKRNNLIANNYQMNRNPFIDYPQWARIAYDPSYSGTGATNALETSSVGTGNTPVDNANLLSIDLITTSVKKTYSLNETFTSAGLIVNGTYDNGITQRVDNYSVSLTEGTFLTTIGSQNITISVTHRGQTKTATYQINVYENFTKELTSISVSSYEPTVKFKDTYNTESVKITAYYNDSTSSDVTSSAIIRYPNSSELGTQSLRVDYTENAISKTIYYDVKVTNNGVIVGEVPVYTTDLFFSEYVEGSSNNKYIEIYNGTGRSVDLSDYNILLFANGATTATATNNLSGTLNHGSVAVYKNSAAVLTLPAGVTATVASAINFNGDDALALQKISTGNYVDIFGKIGEDPGTNWLTNGVKTVDATLVRKSTVTHGVTTNPDVFDPSLEWEMSVIDTSANLGSHNMSVTTIKISALEQANAFALYFLASTAAACDDGNGGILATDGTWAKLSEEYAYMASDTKLIYKNSVQNAEGTNIEHAKARYFLLINRYSALNNDNFMVDNNNTPIFSGYLQVTTSTNNRNFAIIILGLLGTLLIFPIIRKKYKNQ